MDLIKLKEYLVGLGDPLILSDNDNGLPAPFRDFLKTVPGGSVTLSPDLNGITLSNDDTLLTVNGLSTDKWPVQGMNSVTVDLSSVTLTITIDTVNGSVDGGMNITPNTKFDVTITSLKLDENPWCVKLKKDVTCASAFELLLLGNVGTLPFDIPPELESDLGIAATVSSDIFAITFYPNSEFGMYYTLGLEIQGSKWTPIEGVLSFNGISLYAFIKKGSFSVVLSTNYKIGGVGMTIGVSMNGGENWTAFVRPSRGEIFPGPVALAEWAFGQASGQELTTSFNNLNFDLNTFGLAISEITLGFNWKTPKVTFLKISSVLTVKALKLDVVLTLPSTEIYGSLHNNETLNVQTMLSSFGIATNDIPTDLSINEVLLDAQLQYGFYEAAMEIDNIWHVGPISLSALKVLVAYDRNSGLSGEFDCLIDINNNGQVGLTAEYDTDKGWVFAGRTGEGTELKIGDVIAELSSSFGITEVPSALNSLLLKDLFIQYITQKGDFLFSCTGDFIVHETPVEVTFTIDIKHTTTGYTYEMDGSLKIGKITFIIDFINSQGLDYLVATIDPESRCTGNLRDFVSKLMDDPEIIPEGLEIKLEDVFFVLAQEKEDSEIDGMKILFGVDIGSDFDLSKVDVLGTLLQDGTSIGVDDLQALIVTKPFSNNLLININDTLSKLEKPSSRVLLETLDNEFDFVLIENEAKARFKILPEKLDKPGLYLTSIFNFAGYKPKIELPIVKKATAIHEKSPSANELVFTDASDATSEASNVHWCSINKTIGPIQLRRIGIMLDGNHTKFEIDISLVTAGLEIDLLGLWIGIDISNPFGELLSFGIHGLDVAYSQPPTIFNGGLLYIENPMEGYSWEINGQLIVKYNQYGFFADASYAQPTQKRMSSFFAFLMVSAPIGGPPYLYISGLAGGFGFNRTLIVPQASQLSEFPLVQGILGTGNLKNGMKADEALQKMDVYVPPKEHDYWLAAGVAVGSCQIINAFVMVAGVFGTDFDFAIIGVATADVPTGNSPELIAHLELALVGNINPMHSCIEITGAITSNSYLFVPECKLTGGFAYCIWLDRGDFIISVGGYSTAFKKPDYYPTLSRLGINWQISSNLSLKGGAYYAYTPSCAMAGGELDLNLSLGEIKAWLTAHADLLMEWLPFHYDVSIGVNVGVSVTIKVWFVHKTFNLEVGADLHMWGPKFSGEANIHLWIISFTISFGENRNKKPPKLDWGTFSKSLLSNGNEQSKALIDSDLLMSNVLNINIKEGLINGVCYSDGKKDYWVVSPDKFVILTHSSIPSSSVQLKTDKENYLFDLKDFNNSVGIRPMGINSLNTEHVVSILKKEASGNWAQIDLSHVTYSVYSENLPEAIWSGEELSRPSAGTLNFPVGIKISSVDASYYELPVVSTEVFMFKPLPLQFSWGDIVQPTNPTYTEKPIEELKSSIMSGSIVTLRNEILNSLKNNGFSVTESIDLKSYEISAENILRAEPKLFELGAEEQK